MNSPVHEKRPESRLRAIELFPPILCLSRSNLICRLQVSESSMRVLLPIRHSPARQSAKPGLDRQCTTHVQNNNFWLNAQVTNFVKINLSFDKHSIPESYTIESPYHTVLQQHELYHVHNPNKECTSAQGGKGMDAYVLPNNWESDSMRILFQCCVRVCVRARAAGRC